MQPAPEHESSQPPDPPEPCPCTRPSWTLVADLALDLAAAREALAAMDEDEVELVAPLRFRIYRLLGGRTLTLAAFRAKVRHEIATGEHI